MGIGPLLQVQPSGEYAEKHSIRDIDSVVSFLHYININPL